LVLRAGPCPDDEQDGKKGSGGFTSGLSGGAGVSQHRVKGGAGTVVAQNREWSLHSGCDRQENEFDEKHRVATTLLREKAELEKSREDEV
jgi:hypothetical protein